MMIPTSQQPPNHPRATPRRASGLYSPAEGMALGTPEEGAAWLIMSACRTGHALPSQREGAQQRDKTRTPKKKKRKKATLIT